MMPRCFVHCTLPVRDHLLAAGLEEATDLAAWWLTAAEVEAEAQRRAWTEADLGSALMAWSEAKRPSIQVQPKVPVPASPHTPGRPRAVVVQTGGARLSHELVPTAASSLPDMSGFYSPLFHFYAHLADSGALWDPVDPTPSSPSLRGPPLGLNPIPSRSTSQPGGLGRRGGCLAPGAPMRARCFSLQLEPWPCTWTTRGGEA